MLDLSVVIPAYNVETYIERAIYSIINQCCLNLEIIVINDGSTDNTGPIVEKLASCDNRINLINQVNMGLFRARTNGIKYAKGEFITFVDADDFIDDNFYYCLITRMRNEDLDVLEFGYRKVGDNGVIYTCIFTPEYRGRVEAGNKLVSKYNCLASNCNKIYKTCLFRNLNFDEDIRMYEEDMLINIKVFSRISKYYITDSVGYNYYCRDNSITTSNVGIGILNALDSWECVFDYVECYFKDILTVTAMTYCSKLAYYYCLGYSITGNESRFSDLKVLFNSLYEEYNLEKYNFNYESINRKFLIILFRKSPWLCCRIFKLLIYK